jgi:hypothetical protein
MIGILKCDVLVLPAASKPNMSRRISLDPKILFIILEIEPPILSLAYDPPVDALLLLYAANDRVWNAHRR